jgi:signal transduction histidine kinase
VTDPTVVTLEATGRIVSRDEIEESPSLRHGRAALQALFDTLEAVLVAPLGRPGLLTGLLAIGPKISGRPLSADDLDVLRTVANATTSALETARAVAQLQSTRERLQEAEHLAAVGELSAAVAHGIRNPLAGIRIAAQLGREQTGDTTAVRESLDDVLGGVDRLEAQVRGILDFARPFEPTLARMDVGAWLQDVASQIAGQCTERGVTVAVHADGPRPIRGDVAHLTQVLHELVRNALEAMPLGGTITLAAGPCDGDASRVRIVVEDTGSGVPADQQERIFQLFATTKARGTGVGLAVARKIVERHGGSLRLETAAPMAARFAIELPVA